MNLVKMDNRTYSLDLSDDSSTLPWNYTTVRFSYTENCSLKPLHSVLFEKCQEDLDESNTNRVQLLPREWDEFTATLPFLLKEGRDLLGDLQKDVEASVDYDLQRWENDDVEPDQPESTTASTWRRPFFLTSGHGYKFISFRGRDKEPYVQLAIRRCNGKVAKEFNRDDVKPIARGLNLSLQELKALEDRKEGVNLGGICDDV